MDLRDKRALITGGAGLIGSTIADVLIGCGVREIVVLDNFSRGSRNNLRAVAACGRLTVVEGDITDRSLVASMMEGVDVLFHQAAIRITHCVDDPRLAVEVLVNGAFNVFEAAAVAGVEKVVAASSASVYGLATDFPTRESHNPYANRTLYGAAKVFNEGLLRSFNEMFGLSYVALRYFNVYGPRMDTQGAYTEVLVRWMERIAAGRPPLIMGDGTQAMDLIYVDDVARANVLAAQSDATDAVFNVASGEETSLDHLARAVLGVMGSHLEPEWTAERKVNPVRRRLADVSSARDILGFEAKVGLEEGISRLAAWWQSQRPATLPA
jgi:UDP-glucose 4-epimerase